MPLTGMMAMKENIDCTTLIGATVTILGVLFKVPKFNEKSFWVYSEAHSYKQIRLIVVLTYLCLTTGQGGNFKLATFYSYLLRKVGPCV